MKKKERVGVLLALLSAILYAFNVIIEKRYIEYTNPESMLFMMYFGATISLLCIHLVTKKRKKFKNNKLTKKEIPIVLSIVICELLASIFMIESIKLVSASLVSLLSSFEMITTAICSYYIIKDPIKKNEVIAIALMIVGCFILNFRSGVFSNIKISSLLVIAACFCWGIENNLTAMISNKEPAFFTGIKCGAVSIFYLIIALASNKFSISYPILILFGVFTYGISILAYALSTRYAGVNKATLVFSFSPIIGVFLALIVYKEKITISFLISAIIMIAAIISINADNGINTIKGDIK